MPRPQVLLLDEPTAVLPPEEILSFLDVCRRIADAGGAVVLVTHKLAEIASIADRTAILRGGRLIDTVPMQGADMKALVQAMIGRDLQGGAALAGTIAAADPAEEDAPPEPPARPTSCRCPGSSKSTG